MGMSQTGFLVWCDARYGYTVTSTSTFRKPKLTHGRMQEGTGGVDDRQNGPVHPRDLVGDSQSPELSHPHNNINAETSTSMCVHASFVVFLRLPPSSSSSSCSPHLEYKPLGGPRRAALLHLSGDIFLIAGRRGDGASLQCSARHLTDWCGNIH